MKNIFDKFFTGINYWASKNATHMWSEYDAESIENDMKLLQKAGITMLRVFPNWKDFQPLTAYNAAGGIFEYGMHGRPLPDTPAGAAGVDEVMCERFENFCAIAEKYGMKIMVGLLTGHMSFENIIPDALTNLNIVADPVAVRWEIRYIKYLVSRFRNINNIVAWDLGNEIENLQIKNTKDEFYVWTMTLANTIKACDATRPIASGVGNFRIAQGFPNLLDMSECCDINTVHAYNIFETPTEPVNSMKSVLDNIFKCRLSEDIGKMPTFLQEFGAIGYANCSPKTEAEFYRACVLATLAHGFSGAMYWCAFDQGQFAFPPYDWNNIGSDYGFYDKNLNVKPIAEENIRLKSLIDIVGENLPEHKTNCTIIAAREEREFQKDILRASYILAKQANLEPNFTYITDKLPESDIYILPSVKYDKAITNTRLLEILKKVEDGATFYISLNKAYFRLIAELSGVCINNRVDENREAVIKLGDVELPIATSVRYDITEVSSEVLAYDIDGTPLFVKNKYGNGNIYVLFAPVEECAANKSGAFYKETASKFEEIYKCFANNTREKKLSYCDNRFINCTEHYLDDGSVFIFAINYSHKKQNANITLNGEYNLEIVWGKGFNDGVVMLDACDGVLLKAIKK